MVSKKAPTCEEDGVEERVCSVCKKTETRVVSKTGHTYAETWTSNETHHWHASTCGHDVKSSYVEHTPGTDGKCSVCGYQVETPISYQVTEEQYNAAISIAAFENVTIDYKGGFIKFDGDYIEEYEEEDEHSLSVKIAENSFKIYTNQDSQWVELTTTSEDRRVMYSSFYNLGYQNVEFNETNKCYDCTDSKVIENFYVYDKKADSVHQYFEDGKLVKLVSVAGETSLTMSFINYGTTVAARPTTD